MSFQDVTSRNRKLRFEEHGFRYYIESPTDAMHRISQEKTKQAELANRFEERRLDNERKKLRILHQGLNNQIESAKNSALQSLLNIAAHRRVLDELSNQTSRDSKFGRYGLHSSIPDIQPLIDREKEKLHPDYIRREKTASLLKLRRKMELVAWKVDSRSVFYKWRRGSEIIIKDEKDCLVFPALVVTSKDDLRKGGSAHACFCRTGDDVTFITTMESIDNK